MKRFWIGLCVMALLLAGGIGVSAGFSIALEPATNSLQQAAQAAAEADWPLAIHCTDQAQQRWQRFWRFTAAFADHSPMDEIDSLFARLEVLGKQKNQEEFAALCAQLSQLTDALAHSHSLHWWTLL